MPSPNPTTRREYKGNAVPTTLSAPIVNGSDTSFTITSSTGWPTGATGNFVVTINAGQPDVEKILCSTRSGSTVNVVTRGFDSTTAAGHAAGASVVHSISAFDADEWNQHANASAGVHGVAGSVVGTSDTQTLTNKTLTSPTINTPTIATPTVTAMTADAASTVGGVSGTTLAADQAAWSTFTPALTGASIGNGTASIRYKQRGKTVEGTFRWTLGTTSTVSGAFTFTLPVATGASAHGFQSIATLTHPGSGAFYLGFAACNGAGVSVGSIRVANVTGTSVTEGGTVNGTNPFNWAAGDTVDFTFLYESA